MIPEPHQELPEADEKQLCVSCMAPNEPAAHFCSGCGAPLSSYASTAPFESVFAEGSVYRAAAERPQKLVVVLGIWLIFGTMALEGITSVVMMQDGGEAGFFFRILGAGMTVISVAMLWKTTRNYVTRKKLERVKGSSLESEKS
jgi:hypothetical protein